jgi:hypothetical protein
MSDLHPYAEFGGGDSECLCNLRDILDSRVSQTSFNAADVGGIKARKFSQFFLGEVLGLACLADVLPQFGQDGFTFRHDLKSMTKSEEGLWPMSQELVKITPLIH